MPPPLPADVELLLSGGTLVDGTGAAAGPGTLGIRAGRLHVGPDDWRPPAARTIDATGLVVAPGFIDLHSHGGLVILADPRHEPKVRQGVTTEIVGVDGNGYAPFAHRSDLLDFVRLNAGLDGDPALDYDWDSVASYLDRYDRGQAINVGIMVGNSALRIGAIGWEDEPADVRAVAVMRSMLREAMEEGAFGVSSGLDYPPGSYASTDELAAADRRGGSPRRLLPHPRPLPAGRPVPGSVPRGDRDRAARRGAGPHHPLLPSPDLPRLAGRHAGADRRRAGGRAGRHLRCLPVRVGLDQAADPAAAVGAGRWADAPQGPPRRYRRPATAFAARWPSAGAAYASAAGWADVRLGAFSRPDNLGWESRTLADVMNETGQDAVDAICELLLAEDLRVAQVTTGPWTDGLRRFLPHPAAMVGTDSTFLGDKPSPRTYGSFPRILGQFVREERLLSLEEAVHRMTGAPAARLGLRERGLLRDGFAADVVVFDAARVRANATYDEPRQFPDGIEHVIVNGQLVVDGNRHTGALPGRALRHGRS